MTYAPDRRYAPEHEKFIQSILDELGRNLYEKLKKTPEVNLEIVDVKHIYNEKFHGLHRELYLKWMQKTMENSNVTNKVFKSVLTFYGCKPEVFGDIFVSGISIGAPVTSSPLYAIHKSQQGTEVTSCRLKCCKMNETVKIIGGFTILGKTAKLKDLNNPPPRDFNTKMYDIRYDFFMKDFTFATSGNLIADEICVENTLQFLPCFEITYKRIERPKAVWKCDFDSTYFGVELNFHSVYHVPRIQEEFIKVCTEQVNLENFQFMMEYQSLNDNVSDESVNKFMEIYDKFIGSNVERPVNVFGPLREHITTLYQDLKKSAKWTSPLTPYRELEPLSNEVSGDVRNVWYDWISSDAGFSVIRSLKDHPDVVTQSPLYKLFWKLKNSGFNDQERIKTIVYDLSDKDKLLGSYLSMDWNKTLRIEKNARKSLLGDTKLLESIGSSFGAPKLRQTVRIVILNDVVTKKTNEGLFNVVSPILSLFQRDSWQYHETYHTGLMIGGFLFEFDEKEMCIPKKCVDSAAFIAADLGEIGYIEHFESKLDKIAEKVVDWNLNKHYQRKSSQDYKMGNSQDFVDELLDVIGLKFTVSDPMLYFLKEVKKNGSSKLLFHPSGEFVNKFNVATSKVFSSHPDLDLFVSDLFKKDDNFKRNHPNEYNFLKMIDRAFWMKHFSIVREIMDSPNLEGKQERKKFGETYLPMQDQYEKCLCPFKDPTETRSFIF